MAATNIAQRSALVKCAGKTKVDCKICIAGKILYLGTSAECTRCDGKGWIICPVCKGSGKLADALAVAKT